MVLAALLLVATTALAVWLRRIPTLLTATTD
jgi:hypothetical protein